MALHGLFLRRCTLLLLLMSVHALAQLDIIAITPSADSGENGTTNTVLGLAGTQIASSLLPAGRVGMLWGAVPSSAVISACKLLVNTGQHVFTVNINNDWGGSEFLTLQLRATGGCLAESDASGTQFAFVDRTGRFSAVACPSNAGSLGCGVYITGDDVETIYDSWHGSSSNMLEVFELNHDTKSTTTSRTLLGNLHVSVKGKVTGIMTKANCSELGPLAPFCVPGEYGMSRSCTCPNGNCCNDSCFPGDALVHTRSGTMVPMSQLQLGDQVAVLGRDGKVKYDDIYAFGHKDAEEISIFIKIIVEPIHLINVNSSTHHPHKLTKTSTIRLSDHHFIPTSKSCAGSTSLVYKRAKDIQVGDIVCAIYQSNHGVASGSQVLPSRVKDISTTFGHGLYNPFTLSGTIIVDDVVASVHSDWFLDNVFDVAHSLEWLPMAYQLVLAPVRALYQIMGKKAYIFLYDKVDAYLNIAEFGTNYGGHIVLGTTTAALATIIASPFIFRSVVHYQKP